MGICAGIWRAIDMGSYESRFIITILLIREIERLYSRNR